MHLNLYYFFFFDGRYACMLVLWSTPFDLFWYICFFYFVFLFSPLTVALYHTDAFIPTSTSPIMVAFGATQDPSRNLDCLPLKSKFLLCLHTIQFMQKEQRKEKMNIFINEKKKSLTSFCISWHAWTQRIHPKTKRSQWFWDAW